MKKKTTFNIVLSGVFLALALVLPFLTGQIPEIGSMLCPMHLPVLICGFICGWKYGLIVGVVAPILRSLIFTMPPFYPAAIAMAFELGVYGLISGLLYQYIKSKNEKLSIINILITLVVSIIMGRIVWGIVRYLIGVLDETIIFNFKMFLTGAFITAWPGIILQILLVPSVVYAIERYRTKK